MRYSSFSIIVLFVALMIVGVAFIPMLNIRLNPSRSLPQLTVSYYWYNASAKIIEQEVTSKLEGAFNTISGVEDIQSVSGKGYGRITINFKKNSNMESLRFETAMLIRILYPDLPDDVSYPLISYQSADDDEEENPLISYTLNAAASPFFIQEYAENNIADKLSLIKGINKVNIYGANPFLWQITYNSSQIAQLNIKPQEIIQAVNDFFGSRIIGIGIDKSMGNIEQIPVLLQSFTNDTLIWNKIPVKKVKGHIVYLGNIAKVRYQEQAPKSYFRINGLNTVNIVVYPEKGINSIKLAGKVRKTMQKIIENLPPDYSIILAYDVSEDIAKELNKLAVRAALSLIILLLFVLLISRQFNYLLLIFISLTANLLIAFIFYYFLNLEIHLYSLAGITISFGIIIDNSIVMIDHYHRRKNKKAFLSILAATLTTIGSLSIIFFLSKNQQLNLIDFALVIIINLSVSLLTALFFIPALMDKIILKRKKKKNRRDAKIRILKFTNVYRKYILFNKKHRWIYFIILILAFGIPFNLLPEKIEKESTFAKIYNATFGSDFYIDQLKPSFEKYLGGSLRLFTDYVFENAYYSNPQRTVLYVHGSMPEGCTIEQMNQAMVQMENYLSSFDEVQMYQTRISGPQNASINIYFKPEYENSSFPYYLKERLTSKAINLGGLDWGIYGVGKGFSNALYSGMKNSHIQLEGYNYDELYAYAEKLKNNLLKNKRVEDVEIAGKVSWKSNSVHEYLLKFNTKKLALFNISLFSLYQNLSDRVFKRTIGYVYHQNQLQPIGLKSDEAGKFDVWNLNNKALRIDSLNIKAPVLSSIKKQKSGNNIYKFNQQYRLVVSYNFIGPELLNKKVRKKNIQQISEILPLGYRCKEPEYGWWNRKEKKQYYLLFIIILIIYFICSILFESFLQPLAIVAMIPISFIGIFMTFYWFDFNFDQGGFASFILLAGIVVNAGIYIINEYNQIRKHHGGINFYLKAYNHKIIPIFLTIISTVLGLVPFIYAGQNEVFWFAFAAGSIGGLLFSFIAIIVYLPLFLSIRTKRG
ncbi:MAG: efflux RND transporter permease subunit [Bacteroidales bacterium]|nr:efflux RND transporter permease subunit [Bacteroidales bacterium]